MAGVPGIWVKDMHARRTDQNAPHRLHIEPLGGGAVKVELFWNSVSACRTILSGF
jgi:hypothetical protein